MKTDIANLEDARLPLLAQFKAALGLRADQPAPPLPKRFESTPLDVTRDQLWAAALALNPRLKGMEAEISSAEATIDLARKSRRPDSSLGLMADLKAAPAFFRPLGGVSLPVWRDKIAAQIAEAQAGKRAAEARLNAAQIALAVDLADKLYTYREATRNLALTRERLLPDARLSIEVARAGYLAGKTDFLNLLDAQRTLLSFQLGEVDAATQRELSLTELSLIIVGQPPAHAPILSESGATPSPVKETSPK